MIPGIHSLDNPISLSNLLLTNRIQHHLWAIAFVMKLQKTVISLFLEDSFAGLDEAS